jgi:hypothetical protein
MLAIRVSVVVELIVAATATVLVAVSPAAPTQTFAMPVLPAIAPAAPIPVELDACWKLPAPVDAAYRANQFSAAARAVPASCAATSQLLDQLSRAWAIGTDRFGSPIDRLEALQVARTIDLAFGGAHADAIDDAIRAEITRAADAYLAAHRNGDAVNAIATAHLLGVHDHALFAVERRLAQRCVEGPPEYCE